MSRENAIPSANTSSAFKSSVSSPGSPSGSPSGSPFGGVENRPPSRPSMTRRLIFGFGGSFLVLTLISNGLIYVLLSQQLLSQRRVVLRDRLAAISAMLKSPPLGLELLRDRLEREWPLREGEKVFVQITDGAGKLVSKTPVIPIGVFSGVADPMPSPLPESYLNPKSDSLLRDVSQNEYVSRTVQYQNTISLPNPITVKISIAGRQSREFLEALRDALFAVFFVNLLVSLLAGWQIVRRELAPLNEIAKRVSNIDVKNLRERIEGKKLPTELQSLVESFNHTLDRLSDAFDRLSRFSSDIAHELRTPTANIMGSIEVALAQPRSESEYRDLLESNLEECARLNRITDSLLFLARAENLERLLRIEQVAVEAEVERIVEFFEPVAEEKQVQIVTTKQFTRLSSRSDPHLRIRAEPTLFQQVISNLISNAIRHTPVHGKIEISFEKAGEKFARIRVKDSGEGIPAADLSRIFDRFYRVDSSRSVDSGGVGLGLSIVKGIVDLHGGTVSVQSEFGHGACFEVFWPLTDS